jgi:hypothetical protein
MPTRLALCTSLTIALLAAPASALAANVVVPSSVAASTTVPAGGATTLSLHCPAEAVALNAAIARRGSAVTLRRSIPGADPGEWRFRLSGGRAVNREVRAVLRCVRLQLPIGVSGTRLVVSTKRPPGIRIPAGSSTPLEVRCRPGFGATGYGLDRGARRDVKIAEAVPSAGGWRFRLENTGAAPVSARLSVRCLKRTVGARRSGAPTQMSFRTAQRGFSDTIAPGHTNFLHSCRRSEFSLATGSVVDAAGSIALSASHPSRARGGRWAFSHASTGDQVQTFLVCLSRRTHFG